MGKTTRTITNFRGIMTAQSVAQIPPGAAIDCRNVFVDKGGNLNQFQRPTTLIDWSDPVNSTTALDAILSLGYIPIANKDSRLLIQQGKRVLYADSPYTAAVEYGGGDLSGILARLDYAIANGITYFANGQESSYVTPTSTRRFGWGILPPAAAPVQVASTSYGGSVSVQRAAGYVTVIFAVAPVGSLTVGSPIYVDNVAAPWDASFSGVFKIFTSVGLTVTFAQAGPNTATFTRASFPGIPASTLGGYSWNASYGSSDVNHWGTVSDVLAPLVTPANFGAVLMLPPSTDPQVDRIILFRNQDGGGSQILTNAGTGGDGIATAQLTGDYAGYYVILDTTTDEQLTTSGITAPYDNGVAPLGKYVAVWLDRVLMCGISADPTAVRYTGYDTISLGRPQMSWCAFNNIRLGQGQAYPIGMGLLRYGGMVFFATDGFMYIYRGTLNDVTISSPTSLSFYAEQLPYNIGLYSHYSVQSTPAGLVWLDDGFNLRVLENSGFYPPRTFAPQLAGILQRITPGSRDVIQSAYINYLQKDWYLLAIPVDGSKTNNMLIIVDASADPNSNTGAWPTDYAVNGLVLLEPAIGGKELIASMPYLPGDTETPLAGYLTSIPLTDASLQGVQNPLSLLTPNPPMPGGFFRTGYFGITDENGANVMGDKKFFRYTRWSSNSQGISMQAFAVDMDRNTFDNPSPVPIDIDDPGSFVGGVNYKSRCLSIQINFPDDSPFPATLLSLSVAHIRVSET